MERRCLELAGGTLVGTFQRSRHVRRAMARHGGPGDRARRAQTAAGRDLRRRADRHGVDLGGCDGGVGGDRPLPAGAGVPDPDRPPRPARRSCGQGLRHVVGAGCILRLGDRPRGRRAHPRWHRVVSRVHPPRPPRPAAVRHPGGHLARLVPAGDGRVARDLGQGRAHGAGRADDPARQRLPVGLVPRARPLGDAGADVGDRRRPVRQGLAPRRGATHGHRPTGPAHPHRGAHDVVGHVACDGSHHRHIGVPLEGASTG